MPELNVHNQRLKVDATAGGAISNLILCSDQYTKTVISPCKDYHFQSSLLFPFPNRLKSGVFAFDGQTYQFPVNDFGRPNALHGFVHNKTFNLLHQNENSITLGYQYTGELVYYPFPFDLEIQYLLEKGRLTAQVLVKNTGDKPMPCGFGWHPYFNVEGSIAELRIQMSNVDLIEVDEHLIPTGKRTPYRTFEAGGKLSDRVLDSCFLFHKNDQRQSTRLLFPDHSELEIWQETDHPYIQVFTPDDRKTIAIEPMSCAINALNTGEGLQIIEPMKTWSYRFGVNLL